MSKQLSQWLNMDGVSEVRQQTNQLLFRLRDSRQMSDTWHEQTGTNNPMRMVTGRSAMDDAVSSTEMMLRDIDAMLASMSEELDLEENNTEDQNGHAPVKQLRPTSSLSH